MKVAFTGDLFTGGQLSEANYVNMMIDVKAFTHSDIRVVNLEQAAGNNDFIASKSTVIAPASSLSFLVNNDVDVATLANNHIQDKGREGFLHTTEFLTNNKISFLGAGNNLDQASSPVKISNDLYLLSFCDNHKPYLKNVEIAGGSDYGVNPFSEESVLNSLKSLPKGSKAILLVHWGRENVWLPPYQDVAVAKRLLMMDRVHSIVGTHAHRMQGVLKYNNKQAFFCLGDFLFPNFYMKPRTQICYPELEHKKKKKSTREYHPVFSLTYKKWKWQNRLSLLLQFDVDRDVYENSFVFQSDDEPVVNELCGMKNVFAKWIFSVLSYLLLLPSFVYKPLEKIWRYWLTLIRYFNILIFYIFKEKKLLKIKTLKNK